MLKSLHVKNLALIRETETSFEDGLNILSGETGAGKSLIIGSLTLALGGRASASMISKGAEYALVELIFEVSDPMILSYLKELDIFPEDGEIIISRKIYDGRSVCRINGETVNATVLKNVAEYLIDIHGQHEHQSLLYEKNHLSMLDKYAKDELSDVLTDLKAAYKTYAEIKEKYESEIIDDKEKNRDISVLEHEVSQINAANLKLNEDEELEKRYQLLINSKKIIEGLGAVHGIFNGNGVDVSSMLSKALREMADIEQYDDTLNNFYKQLLDIEELINDFNRGVSGYIDDFSFDAAEFNEIEERLNLINRFKERYGNTIEEILEYATSAEEKLRKYSDYDAYIEKLKSDLEDSLAKLKSLCDKAHEIREKYANELSKEITKELMELNFDNPQFKVDMVCADKYSSKGSDSVRFLISLNAGEDLKPLSSVASGGELSRIMLALKCVCADFGIDTMIFDEIDTGISGRTAGMVAKKLSKLSEDKQVICITHLPQIAAYADVHYLIEKSVNENVTSTNIKKLASRDERIDELSRILGGEVISEAVRENAMDLLKQAGKM